jgi:pre-mRNA-splicing factor SPF27
MPTKEKKHDVAAWKSAVDNAHAQVEHQRNRARNLELMSMYGTQAWKMRGGQLENVEKAAQAQFQALQEAIQEVNWDRKTEQERHGEELHTLETQWGALVSKNFEIERACAELEAQIAQYNKEAEAKATAE